MTPTLQVFLIVSAALFSIGLLAALSRRHAIFILIGIEMMLAAANVNFIAFWRFGPQHQPPIGVMIALFLLPLPLPRPPLVLPWLSPFIATITRPTSISLISSKDEFLDHNLALVDPRSAVCGFADHFEFVEGAAKKRSRTRRNWPGIRARAVDPGVCANAASERFSCRSEFQLVHVRPANVAPRISPRSAGCRDACDDCAGGALHFCLQRRLYGR